MTGGLGTMLHVWWNANMDARRSISVLLVVVGGAVIALGIAASPDSLAFGPTYGAFMVPAFIGAGIGGYRRHRSDRGSSVRTTPNGPGSISHHCLSMRRLPPSHLRLPLPSHRPTR
jgi:hypothetical protein